MEYWSVGSTDKESDFEAPITPPLQYSNPLGAFHGYTSLHRLSRK